MTGNQLDRGRVQRGSRHYAAKLTNEAVDAIRERLVEGVDQRSIAREFGVSQSTINDINMGRTWK